MMGSIEPPYLIEKLIERDCMPKGNFRPTSKRKFSYIGWACVNAKKYLFDQQALDSIERARQHTPIKSLSYAEIWPPVWIESPGDILSPGKSVTGILFFTPARTYDHWTRSNHVASSSGEAWAWTKWQKVIVGFNTTGKVIMELVYPFRAEEWVFPSSHVCPYRQCRIEPLERGQHLVHRRELLEPEQLKKTGQREL